ncbi:hypothetical protein ACVRXQ_09035 [Streptococcus panodentis]|uniref:Uncharacterized protein n=1 Tax=Streptococcus panodentis TaxID=1581472 RepID=A0ABS5AWR7_9STRE|nr:hypothetical protein [Streptococcus panodentis]MBP2621016.1 hypothetical protein [Streptococcus panodentis]
MSDLSQLKAAVLEQAHEKGRLLLSESKARLAQDSKKQEARLEQEKLQQRTARLKDIRRRSQRDLQQLENQKRQSSLAIKQRVLGELFEEAYQKMAAWSDRQELAFIGSVLKKYSREPLVLEFGSLTYEKLSSAQVQELRDSWPQLEVAETSRAGQAGFVLSRGRIDDSYLYRDLLDAVRQEESCRLAQAIFRDAAE